MRVKISHYIILLLFFFICVGLSALTVYFNHILLALPLKFKILVYDVNSTLLLFVTAILFNNCCFNEIYWSIIPIFQTPYLMYNRLFRSDMQTGLKQFLHLGIVIFWACRLSFNYLRGWRGLGHQDFRVEEYRRKLKNSNILFWLLAFFIFFFITNALLYAGKLSHLNFYSLSSSSWHILDVIALATMLSGGLIELVADEQLYRFRIKNISRRNCINEGLWYYSRHPNYFGEILFWVGSSLACWESFQADWTSLIGGAVMILMFFGGSAQWSDRYILEKSPAYKRDMDEKSMIVPWFRRKRAAVHAEKTKSD